MADAGGDPEATEATVVPETEENHSDEPLPVSTEEPKRIVEETKGGSAYLKKERKKEWWE